MASVKLSKKLELERIQAKILLITGTKTTQQELLDKCINYVERNFDDFVEKEMETPHLTKKKIDWISKFATDSGYAHPELTDDELLYDKYQ